MTRMLCVKSQDRLRKKLPIWKKLLFVTFAIVITIVFVYSRYLYPTGEVMQGLYAVKGGGNNSPMVNFFLLDVGDGYIAIDVGANSLQTENELQKLGISADDIIAVFITHSHYDHIGALHLFDNVPLYTGNTEFQYATSSRFSPTTFEIPDMPHNKMTDGEIIKLNDITIQCIYTPGHTSDSVSFLVDGKYLFVGDLFVTLNTAEDEELMILSRKNVLGVQGAEYVFTGHFGLVKDVRLFRWWFD